MQAREALWTALGRCVKWRCAAHIYINSDWMKLCEMNVSRRLQPALSQSQIPGECDGCEFGNGCIR